MGRPTSPSVQTVSGVLVDLYHPDPDTIVWTDIAHALAQQCRFNGHTKRFYSVAEHSYRVSFCVPAEDALWGLIHDAAEAYIGDIVSPVKRLFPEVDCIERRLMDAIAWKLGLGAADLPASVLEADARMLATEAHCLLTGDISWCKAEPYSGDLEHLGAERFWTPAYAYAQWRLRMRELTGGAHG